MYDAGKPAVPLGTKPGARLAQQRGCLGRSAQRRCGLCLKQRRFCSFVAKVQFREVFRCGQGVFASILAQPKCQVHLGPIKHTQGLAARVPALSIGSFAGREPKQSAMELPAQHPEPGESIAGIAGVQVVTGLIPNSLRSAVECLGFGELKHLDEHVGSIILTARQRHLVVGFLKILGSPTVPSFSQLVAILAVQQVAVVHPGLSQIAVGPVPSKGRHGEARMLGRFREVVQVHEDVDQRSVDAGAKKGVRSCLAARLQVVFSGFAVVTAEVIHAGNSPQGSQAKRPRMRTRPAEKSVSKA